MDQPRVLVVDDHILLAQSLATALRAEGIVVATSSGPTTDDVLAAADALHPDLVALDLDLGDMGSGTDLIAPLVSTGALVVLLTGSLDRIAHAEAVEAGAVGVIEKSRSFDELVASLTRALTDGRLLSPHERTELLDELRRHRKERATAGARFERLTPREREVLAALMEGLTAEQMASAWTVSMATVRSQIRGVLTKLEVSTQLAAVAEARAAGWSADFINLEDVGR